MKEGEAPSILDVKHDECGVQEDVSIRFIRETLLVPGGGRYRYILMPRQSPSFSRSVQGCLVAIRFMDVIGHEQITLHNGYNRLSHHEEG
jgi:hypothetical protein